MIAQLCGDSFEGVLKQLVRGDRIFTHLRGELYQGMREGCPWGVSGLDPLMSGNS